MKSVKLALLAGAALAVTAAGAQADDLGALKAQIESLNARIATLEAAPSVPNGYSLLTISEGAQPVIPGLEMSGREKAAVGDKATVIGVMPTADAPAATEIVWSGYARAAIVYFDVENDGNDADLDIYARGQIKVTGKTDTAVGEVGATVEFRGNFDGQRTSSDRVYIEQAWGYWAMTPELTLGGGFAGSLGALQHGYDGVCNCYYTDNADVYFAADTSQMRLSYASGPLSMAIAVEDATGNGGPWDDLAFSNNLGAAGEIKYNGDTFSAELAGVYRNTETDDNFWQIGAGATFSLSDMFSLSGTIFTGSVDDDDYWGGTLLASANLSDEFHGEVAVGMKDYDSHEVAAVLAGIYYDPVSQLTIGLEGEWIDDESASGESVQLDLVTVFRF